MMVATCESSLLPKEDVTPVSGALLWKQEVWVICTQLSMTREEWAVKLRAWARCSKGQM